MFVALQPWFTSVIREEAETHNEYSPLHTMTIRCSEMERVRERERERERERYVKIEWIGRYV